MNEINNVCYTGGLKKIGYNRKMIFVLSYNIQFGRKLDQISQWIETQKQMPDIICFQEFPEKHIQTFISNFNEGLYGYQYSSSFKKRNIAYGQLTLFQKHIIKLTDHYCLDLGHSVGEKILFRNSGNRSSLITVFKYKRKSFAIANTHLMLLHINKRRRSQLQIIMDMLKKNISHDVPQIILGDLNYSSLIGQKKLIKFMDENKFYNAYKLKTHRLLFFHHQLDYVFYKNCKIINPQVTKLHFSDHYPVQFQVDF